MEMRNVWLLIGVALGASSAGAQNVATMIEDIGEDLAMYHLVGKYCGLSSVPAADAITRLLLEIDPKSAEKGAGRASLMLDGAKVRAKKSEICAAARAGRPKLEAQLPDTLKGLESMKRVAASARPEERPTGSPLASASKFPDYLAADEGAKSRWATNAASAMKIDGRTAAQDVRRCLDALPAAKVPDLNLGMMTAMCGMKLKN